MSMTFSFHDDLSTGSEPITNISQRSGVEARPAHSGVRIVTDKLKVPEIRGMLARPRLNELLARSVAQFSATLISGRSGTGKTALAASFAKGHKRVAWFSVESADINWRVFANHFAAAIGQLQALDLSEAVTEDESQAGIADFLAALFRNLSHDEQCLIVLDDIHKVFDAQWFHEFFDMVMFSLPPNAHLILLCRSKPPNPIWRLRSKQVLGVIGEKVLAFTEEEAAELFERCGVPKSLAERAWKDSFGRISKLKENLERPAL